MECKPSKLETIAFVEDSIICIKLSWFCYHKFLVGISDGFNMERLHHIP